MGGFTEQELSTENDNMKDNEGQQEELKLVAKKIKICSQVPELL